MLQWVFRRVWCINHNVRELFPNSIISDSLSLPSEKQLEIILVWGQFSVNFHLIDERDSRLYITDFCGATTGTCGGAGATCYSQSTDDGFITCNSPGKVLLQSFVDAYRRRQIMTDLSSLDFISQVMSAPLTAQMRTLETAQNQEPACSLPHKRLLASARLDGTKSTQEPRCCR